MAYKQLPGFGVQLPELTFDGWLDWFVKVDNPLIFWRAQPTYILAALVFLLGAAGNLVHAILNGGRLPYLWLATVLHGIVVEIVTYNLEDIDNFWHSQTPVIFLGRRLPLHIIALYPVFIYHASVAVSKLRLPTWAEPFAVGLTVVLVDIPYDVVSVKFAHWTWHDTDPNIFDRHYWVPWNSYYFHACFAASFTFWFHGWRRWLYADNLRKWDVNSVVKELVCVVLTAVLGMPGGVLLFLPLYHPLHDLAGIHSEVTFFMIFTIFLLICWTADRTPSSGARPYSGLHTSEKGLSILLLHLALHYSLYLSFVIFGHPEEEVSIGLHERIGPCNETVPVYTASGIVLSRRRYLCTSDYDEDYFDFHCLPNGQVPSEGNRWILPIWTKTPHQQPPLDYTELEKYPLPPQQVFDTAEIPLEYMELTHKKESDL
ncbi:uncharacterized protein LOC110827445 [Zootermopsis nevadensis]|uniref:uncharacterized protein LOC110827445 n=1 Tax=Zootermopsis nevadensis TaxID=136037 RepID=UPI000B8E239B|nr:uncharacterized protein LOC110827445 [Zootermopsis nevadensis]